jgi:hypothetical protein
MNTRNSLLFIALALASACATAPRALERGDWQVTWTEYVEHESQGLAGKVWSPAPGATQLVLGPAEFAARNKDIGMSMSGGLGMGPPGLEALGAVLPVQVGEAQTFDVPGEALRAAWHRGTAARAYWTIDHRVVTSVRGKTSESKASELIVLGVEPGRSTLELELADGSRKTVEVDVTARRAAP